ncbi:MAG: 5'/3'-nucleotidase SurE [Bacteroidetes bacterium]|nr:5'/3'-nucleotidase SurE [Bacteroidota bacterium]
MQKKRILVTNDDGITAPGILALSKIAKQFGEVYVVAPDKPQSGMGHAITINSTLRLRKSRHHQVDNEFVCSGTPVDCVKIALNKLMPHKPDLILSGINHGSNLSINVIYSGTMSAAVEGAIEGIPSIGFSLCDYSIDADFSQGEAFIKTIIEKILNKKQADNLCLNVNIPKLKADEIQGIQVCRGAKSIWIEDFDERQDPYGTPYYWLTGTLKNFEEQHTDTDLYYNQKGFVTLVPIGFDMTKHEQITTLSPVFLNE